jgi:DNA adenine methylase
LVTNKQTHVCEAPVGNATGTSTNRNAVFPILKYAGGKRRQVPRLREWWEPRSTLRLVEPFCGGLAVALGLQPERALLNDINEHVVNFHRQVRDGLTIDIEMKNDEALFYRHRERFNELALNDEKSQTAEAAALFYYLNKTDFNGLCRFNTENSMCRSASTRMSRTGVTFLNIAPSWRNGHL